MQNLLPLLIGLSLLWSGQVADAQQSKIHVTFTNRSGYNVAYRLSGGGGRECRIAENKTVTWVMMVDRGEPPTVAIHQVKGKDEVFSVSNGGNYVFLKDKRGKIVNAYK